MTNHPHLQLNCSIFCLFAFLFTKGPKTWHMLYGMDMSNEKGLVIVADNFGYLYM